MTIQSCFQWQVFSVELSKHDTVRKMQIKQSKNTYRICINRGKKWSLFFKTGKDQLNDYQSKVDVKRGKPEPFIYMALEGKKKRNIVMIVFIELASPDNTHTSILSLWLFHSCFWEFLSSSPSEYHKLVASRNYLTEVRTRSVKCLRTRLSPSFSLNYVKFQVLAHLHCMQTPSGIRATRHPFQFPPRVLARSRLKHSNCQPGSKNIHLLQYLVTDKQPVLNTFRWSCKKTHSVA